jgi:hypothetical protein
MINFVILEVAMKFPVVALFFVFFTSLISQPVLDGKVTASEYRFSVVKSGITVNYDFIGNYFYAAVTAPAKGWVALGLNSSKMDKALILIGFVKDGAENSSVERGNGHSHKKEAGLPVADFKLKETAEGTTMEIRIAATALAAGAKVPFMAAFSNTDSYSAFHSGRTSGEFVRP